jgi:hypothetical protein
MHNDICAEWVAPKSVQRKSIVKDLIDGGCAVVLILNVIECLAGLPFITKKNLYGDL